MCDDRDELIEKLERYERALRDVYPSIAGRASLLEQAGERVAAAQWNALARKVNAAFYEPPQGGPSSPFHDVTDDLTGGDGCACHTGIGYNTSCVHCRPASQGEPEPR